MILSHSGALLADCSNVSLNSIYECTLLADCSNVSLNGFFTSVYRRLASTKKPCIVRVTLAQRFSQEVAFLADCSNASLNSLMVQRFPQKGALLADCSSVSCNFFAIAYKALCSQSYLGQSSQRIIPCTVLAAGALFC